ncbi:hypothetical protein [Candidatus Palauibacter sp.]|uniref:hypothetical protein n=1 Tax=Candidatus Palauibacter sp. TaxID=3101350 RepID=UPI003AF22C95
MTPEMWTIIGVGIALAAALLPGQRALRKDLAALTGDVSDLRGEFAEFRERMAREMGALRERLTRQEGLFEGFSRRRKNPKTI